MNWIILGVLGALVWGGAVVYGRAQRARDAERTRCLRVYFAALRDSIVRSGGIWPDMYYAHIESELAAWGLSAEDLGRAREHLDAYVRAVRAGDGIRMATNEKALIRLMQLATGAAATG